MSNKFLPTFILLASGSSITPCITHAMFESLTELAQEESIRVIKQLSKAGYYVFDLFDVREDHVLVESYRVETPEPIVTVKGKK
ncbi:hypothetical protein EVB55_091 [Rhizobium phage RHph_Y68]|uniref:Uncharacterized protein n=1 Tax=Rhizobium phage RHph_Y68 TaxID=2509787 RepID=A0A7S5R362_9CAUD|nr:hypothetical protein PP934_gp091 [Rhizobium phage RHph_Y68]QIG68026.1 hypothetical protein EVB55_091 [Rhizobium phage RHph_Y68]